MAITHCVMYQNMTHIVQYLISQCALNKDQTFLLEYDNEIYREIPLNGLFVDGTAPISSSTFTFNNLTGCSFRDNGNGLLQIVQDTTSGLEVINTNVGTVNYAQGLVNINSFNTSLFNGNAIRIYATPISRMLIFLSL